MGEVHSGAVGWVSLAAAPTFAIMALATGILVGSPGYMVWAAGHAVSLDGMVPMYLLMSAFHSPPWLKMIFSRSAAKAAFGKGGTVGIDMTRNADTTTIDRIAREAGCAPTATRLSSACAAEPTKRIFAEWRHPVRPLGVLDMLDCVELAMASPVSQLSD